MQSRDEQPTGNLAEQHSEKESEDQQSREARANENIGETEQTRGDVQGLQGDQTTPRPQEGQVSQQPGLSEQIPFSLPQAPLTSQSGPMAPTGPTWNYPPNPQYYQRDAFGQVQQPSVTQPIRPVAPGQFGQPANSDPWLRAASQAPAPQYPQPGSAGVFPQAGIVSNNQSAKPRRSGLRTGAIIALILLLAAVFGSGVLSGWALSHNNSSNDNVFQSGNNSTVTVPQLNGNNLDAVREAVISKVQPGVVQIDVITASQHALGSGVIIDGRGYIITNNHVATNANSIQVTLADGTVLPAQLSGTDSADDLAVIKITPPPSGLTVVTLGDSSQLKVGQGVLAIGSPLGNANTVTSGIVSALNRSVSEGQSGPTLPDAIQTDAPINPGNSGGALVDLQGHLIGIPTLNAIDTEFNTPANGLGFAIPSNRVRNIAQQILTDGHVTHTGRPLLGVEVISVNQTVVAQYHLSVNSGALIVKVNDGSSAASAGLQVNDVIVQVNSATIHNTSDLNTTLLRHKPGESVAITVYRGSQQLTMNLTLGELPAN
jgi:S1-C subfamily serine protease